jgi:hypothetical protein
MDTKYLMKRGWTVVGMPPYIQFPVDRKKKSSDSRYPHTHDKSDVRNNVERLPRVESWN